MVVVEGTRAEFFDNEGGGCSNGLGRQKNENCSGVLRIYFVFKFFSNDNSLRTARLGARSPHKHLGPSPTPRRHRW